MPWWPYWEGEWYEALLWILFAIVFGTLFGWGLAQRVIDYWNLNDHRRRWEPYHQRPWWKRLWDLLTGGDE